MVNQSYDSIFWAIEVSIGNNWWLISQFHMESLVSMEGNCWVSFLGVSEVNRNVISIGTEMLINLVKQNLQSIIWSDRLIMFFCTITIHRRKLGRSILSIEIDDWSYNFIWTTRLLYLIVNGRQLLWSSSINRIILSIGPEIDQSIDSDRFIFARLLYIVNTHRDR